MDFEAIAKAQSVEKKREIAQRAPWRSDEGVSYLNDKMIDVLDNIKAIGENRTYVINRDTRFHLAVDKITGETKNSPFLDQSQMSVFTEKLQQRLAHFDDTHKGVMQKYDNDIEEYKRLKNKYELFITRKKDLDDLIEKTTKIDGVFTAVIGENQRKVPNLLTHSVDENYLSDSFTSFVDSKANFHHNNINNLQFKKVEAINIIAEKEQKLNIVNEKINMLRANEDEIHAKLGLTIKNSNKNAQNIHMFDLLGTMPDYKESTVNRFTEMLTGNTAYINGTEYDTEYDAVKSRVTAYVNTMKEQQKYKTELNAVSINDINQQIEEETKLFNKWSVVDGNEIDKEVINEFKGYVDSSLNQKQPIMPKKPTGEDVTQIKREALIRRTYDETIGEHKFVKLTQEQLNEALQNVDDPTLKVLLNEMYTPGDNDTMIPRKFFGTVDIMSVEKNDVHTIRGILNIEDPNFDLNHAIGTHLSGVDAYGIVKQLSIEDKKINDTDGLQNIVDHINTYRENQKEMTIEQKQSQYRDTLNGEDIAELKRMHFGQPSADIQDNYIPNRIVGLMDGDTGLIDGPANFAVRRNKDGEILRVAGKAPTKGTPSGLSLAIKGLSEQSKFEDLQLSAKELRISLGLFDNFMSLSDNGNYRAMEQAVAQGLDSGHPYRLIGDAYKTVMEQAKLDYTVPLGALPGQTQEEVARRMSIEMTGKLDGQLFGLQAALGRETKSSPYISEIYDALSEHSNIIYDMEREHADFYDRGTTQKDTGKKASEVIGEQFEEAAEHNKALNHTIDSLNSAMDLQENLMQTYTGSNVAIKDKKDLKAYLAGIKDNYELVDALDVAKIDERPAAHFLLEELQRGSITVGNDEIPLQNFKQFYTMNSMKEIMGEDWSHFTQEEWESGQIKFGKTSMPIDQMSEYYTKAERIYQAGKSTNSIINNNRISKAKSRSDKKSKIPISKENYQAVTKGIKKEKLKNVALSPQEIRTFWSYASAETAHNSGKTKILVKKQVDNKLVKKLSNAMESGEEVVTKKNVVPYVVESVDKELGIAVLNERHVPIDQATFSFIWDGEEPLYKKLKEADKLANKFSPQNRPLSVVKEYDNLMLNKTIGHTDLTRRELLETATKGKGGMPKLIEDMMDTSFSWMRLSEESSSEMLSQSYISAVKAFGQVDDIDILKAFTQAEVKPEDFRGLSREAKDQIINNAFSHRVETSMLIGIMDQMSNGRAYDEYDTAIRTAKTLAASEGINNPTQDQIRDYLMQIEKGMYKLKSEETKSYFNAVGELAKSPTMISERMAKGASITPLSIEDIRERATKDVDENVLDNFIENSLGLNTNSKEADAISQALNDTGEEHKPKVYGQEVKDLYKRYHTEAIDDYYGTNMKNLTGVDIKDIQQEYEKALKTVKKQQTNKIDLHDIKNVGKILDTSKIKTEDVSIALQTAIDKVFKKQHVGVPGEIGASIRLNNAQAVQAILDKVKNPKDFNPFGEREANLITQELTKFVPTRLKKSTPHIKMAALHNMEKDYVGSSSAIIQIAGGIEKSFSKIFGIDVADVKNMATIENQYSNIPFGSIEDVRTFLKTTKTLIPGLDIGVQFEDADGRTVKGRLGSYTDPEGFIDPIMESTDGDKYRIVNHSDEAKRIYSLGGKEASDVTLAKQNKAKYHISTPGGEKNHYKAVAGFIGNYDMITRRPGNNPKAPVQDPISTFDNLNKFKSEGKGLIFDFETTGLPDQINKLGEEYKGAFAPIEFSYATVEDAKNLNIKKADVTSVYARPNEATTRLFEKAMAEEFTPDGLGITQKVKQVGGQSPTYSILKNYGKYDSSRVTFGEKSYTWGSVITSKMQLGEDGKLIASINDELIPTNMTFDEMQMQTKKSADKVFNYLATVSPDAKRGKFGIAPSSVVTQNELLKDVGKQFGNHNFLIAHNGSTADIPWNKTWALETGDEELIAQALSADKKMIDTQDVLQASNSGRRMNNLESFSTNKSKSHLAYNDVITNAKALKTLMKDKQVIAISKQVDEGLPMGSYIQKTRDSQIGMGEIKEGTYKINKLSDRKGEGIIELQRLTADGKLGDAKTYKASNLAVIRKELADNWINLGEDEAQAIAREQVMVRQNANRTIMKGASNGAMDRYIFMGTHENFDFQKDLLEKLRAEHNKYQKKASLPEQSSTRFTSQTIDDLGLFIQANSKRLSREGYFKEVNYINDVDANRVHEMRGVADYFKTDEGKMVKSTIDKINTRNDAGIYTSSMRNEAGRRVYDAIADVKRNAVDSGKLGSEYMIQVPDKYVAGTIKFEHLTGDMQQYLQAQKDTFKEIPIVLSLDSAERTKGDIFNATESIAKRIQGMETIGDINVAKQRVVNEVVLPILAEQHSTNKALNQAIASRLNNEVSDDYLNAVHTMSSELVMNKEKVIKKMTPLTVVDISKPLDKTVHKDLYEELQDMLTGILADFDKERTHIITTDEKKVVKYIPVEGAQEVLEKLVDVQAKNKQRNLEVISEMPAYKKLVEKHGFDPIKEGIDIFPKWNHSLENSVGMVESGALDAIKEFRYTSKESNKWMQNKSAKTLINILDQLPTFTNHHDYLKVAEAFGNKDAQSITAQANYRKTHADIIADIEQRMKNLNKDGISDISHIANLNKGIIESWGKEYANEAKAGVRGNGQHKGEIMRELYKRAQMTDSAYNISGAEASLRETGTITQQQINANPTKYNAMKAVGLLQEKADGVYHTGSIALPGNLDKNTLDASKILVPGNKGNILKDALTGAQNEIYINQYAGMPLNALTLDELELVANNKKASYGTGVFEDYYERLKGLDAKSIKDYEDNARKARQAFIAKDKAMKRANIHELIPEYTSGLSDVEHIAHINEATKAAGHSVKPSPQYAMNFDSLNRPYKDNPLYDNFKKNKDVAFDFIKQHKKGFAIGAAAIGVIAGLQLTKPKSSNGRAANQMPQPDQAPNVDGTYDKEYNKYEDSRGHFIPNTKQIRLEEGGGGLNVRARGVNRKNVSDDNFDKVFSDILGSYGGASGVAIKHSDDRASINNEYVQSLVSNSLFG